MVDKLPSGQIRYPSHGWGALADNPTVEIGARGPAWIAAVRSAWLRSGGTEQSFEEMFPQYAPSSSPPAPGREPSMNIDRAYADAVMKACLSIGDHLNSLSALTERIENEAERREFRRAIGEIIGTLYVDIMRPVVKQYPDLDPDKDAG